MSVTSGGILTYSRPKNAHNEAERQQVNMEKTIDDFDNSIENQVRKVQRVGTTLIGYDRNAPTPKRPPTTRA